MSISAINYAIEQIKALRADLKHPMLFWIDRKLEKIENNLEENKND